VQTGRSTQLSAEASQDFCSRWDNRHDACLQLAILNLNMRSVRLFLAGLRGLLPAGPGLFPFLLSVLLSLSAAKASAQIGGAFSFTSQSFDFVESEGTARVVVTRNSEVGKMLVDLIVANGTATNGVHFRLDNTTNTLTFEQFQTAATFPVPLRANSTTNSTGFVTAKMRLANPRPAPDENPQFTASISRANNAADLNILDDDTLLRYNIERTAYVTDEPNPTNVITVVVNVFLTQPPAADGTSAGTEVDYVVTTDFSLPVRPGSDYATPVEDYEPIDAGTLTFGPTDVSLPITITITNDSKLEFSEDFHVILRNPRGEFTPNAPEEAPANGVAAAATDGGTTAGTDGGAAPAPEPIPYALGPVSYATVTILFNGTPPQDKAAGSLDLEFNADNDPDTFPPSNTSPGANNAVFSLAHDADGNLVLGGDFSAVNAVTRNRIARMTPEGQLDTTFNPVGGANDFVSAVAVYTNGVNSGKVLLAGGFTSVNGFQRNGVARLNANGAIDETFNPGNGADGPIYAMVLQKDGGILIGGNFTTFNGIPRNRLARLLGDGSVDTTFDPGTGADGPVYSISSESAAPVIITVGITNDNTAGYVRNIDVGPTAGFFSITYNFYTETNDLIILQGTNVLHNSGLIAHAVYLTNADGTLRTNYVASEFSAEFPAGRGPIRIFINTQTNLSSNFTFTATMQPFISLGSAIGGDFTEYDGIEHGRVAKLNNDGSADLSFNTFTGTGADGTVYAVAFQQGRVVLGGAFSSFNSFPAGGIAALNSDGSFDRNFAVGVGAEDGDVLTIRVMGNNRLLLGGSFNYINQTRRTFLTRLLPNGPVDTSFLDPSYNQYAGFPSPDGFWPEGSVNAVAETENGDVVVGGLFSRAAGGLTRTEVHPRSNLARLHGGNTPGPGNLELLQKVFGGDENGGGLSLVFSRTNGSLGSGGALVSTLDGAAFSTNDYVGVTNFPVLWGLAGSYEAPGATNNAVRTIKLNDDGLIEGNENFLVTLDAPFSLLTLGGEFIPAGFALGSIQSGQGLVVENDVTPASFRFSASEFLANENDTRVTISVERTGGSSAAVSVRYATFASTNAGFATENVDYTPATGSLSFASGQTNKTFTVTLRDDELVEQDELVGLILFSPSPGSVLGTNVTVPLILVDNDYAPGRISLSATNYAVAEGEQALITVDRRGGNVGVLTVNYATVDGTALAGSDYAETTGVLRWDDGDAQPKTLSIPIGEDGLVEGPKQFSIRLTAANLPDALGSRTNSTVTIQDDDALGAFSFNAAEYLADENGTNVVVNVIRRAGSAEIARVNYATTNLTAVAGTDYQAVSGTLEFAVGETSKSFAVPVIDNLSVNPERRIGLVLSNPQPAGAALGVLSNAVIALIDNETVNIPAGSVETDFGTGSGANDAIHTLALQPDGKILLGGDFLFLNRQLRTQLARVREDGSLDTAFGVDYDINGSVRDIELQGDGRLLIAGSFTEIDSFPTRHLARMSVSGVLDNTFNVGSGADSPIFAVEETFVEGTRKILIGGSFSTFNGVNRRGVARVNEDGRTDVTFNPGSGVNGTVYAVYVQRDGKILIGGDFNSVNSIPRVNIARLNADGSLDLSFDAGLGADGSVRSIAVQFDDRVLIGGLFSSVSGVSRERIARLMPDGTLDASFSPGSGANGAIYAIAIQLDGKILIGGDYTSFAGIPQGRISRLNPDGTIDPSINFGTGANAFVGAIAIQSNRRIVVSGGFTEFDGLPRSRYARLYGGSLKGSGGIEFSAADYRISENSTNLVVTVRRSGGLLGAVGIEYLSQANTASAAVDYNDVSGTLSFLPGENFRTFSLPLLDDGLAEPDERIDLILRNPTGGAALGNQPVAAVTLVSDDSVLGFSDLNYTVNESAAGGRAVVQIRREGETANSLTVIFTARAGTAAAGVDFTAVTTTATFLSGQDSAAVQVPILEDTEVEANETVTLRLQNPSGGAILGRPAATLTILDNDFSPGRLSVVQGAPSSENSGGAGVTVARVSGSTGAISVRYALSDGTATAGQDYVASSGTLSFLEGETTKSFFVPLLDDARIEGNETFIVTLSNPTGDAIIDSPTAAILILDDDFGPGSLDTSFNTGGGAAGTVSQIRLQPDGKILVVGDFFAFGGFGAGNVARLNANGSVDSAFVFSSSGTDLPVRAVVDQFDGRIAVGGEFTTLDFVGRRHVSRLQTNGSPDANFSISAAENGAVLALASDGAGKVIAGGQFTAPTRRIVRLNTDGSLDVSFNPDGGADGEVRALALLPNGRLLVGGSFSNVAGVSIRGLARLMPNGLIDLSFQIGQGVIGAVNAIAVLPDGKILVGGEFTSAAGVSRTRVALLNADGTLDRAFNPASPNGAVSAVLAHRGKFYIGGLFTSVGGTARRNIARLNADGTLDTVFDPGIGPDGAVLSLAAQSTGQILIGGSFTSVNGFTTAGVARLNAEPVNPSQEIRLTGARTGGGFFLCSFASEIGVTYAIEASGNLRTWQTVETKTATSASTDVNAVINDTHRYFRVRVNP